MKFSRYFPANWSIGFIAAGFLCSAPWARADGIDLTACELPAPAGLPAVSAQCGTLMVAEDPQQTAGRQISLRVAKVPAQAAQALPDPVFIFAGGPGQAATEAYPLLARAFEAINRERDIVLVDQRGTGGSNPLRCPVDLEDLTRPLDLDQLRSDTRECLEQLTDSDPRLYTTTIAMGDYEQVRLALGYEQINLWGGSYGTRAAQVYLRHFPDAVRTMTLDSVAPPRLALGGEHARQLQRVLDTLLSRCEQDADCDAAFPRLRQQYAELVQSLTDEPRVISINDPRTGAERRLLADRNSLAMSLRLISYSAAGQALVPLLINRAARGQLERVFVPGLMAADGFVDQLARGMELSVTCAEDEPFLGDASAEVDTLIGTMLVDVIRVSCSVWPRGEVPDDFHDPYPSAVPTLLLAGEMDPVTPPAYAHEAAQQYSRHQVIEARGRGHLVTPHGCIPSVLAAFIDTADAQSLDAECVERLGPEPFFVDLTGPTP